MIQTKTAVFYWKRSNDSDIVKVEIRADEETDEGQYFLVIDWLLSKTDSAFFSKKVFKTNDEIDAIEAYILANYDLSRLTHLERENRKLAIALMLDTTQNLLPNGKTIYGLTPSDWEFSV